METQFNTSLWGDEGFSAILSMKPPLEIIRIIIRDTSPPLYNLTEHLAFQMFGVSEVVIRSLSFFYYCLTILFVYLIGSFLWNRRTGLLAAALSFFNPFFFIYAFEGRMYAILALGVTASMYFYLRLYYLKTTPKTAFPASLILGYIFSTAWALYSHHFSIFIIFIQGLWFLPQLILNRKKALFLFLGFLGTTLLYLPWLYPLYLQTKMVGGGFWLGTPTLKNLSDLILEYLAQGIKHPLAKPALSFTLLSLLFRNWLRNLKITAILLSWFLGPILLTWLISQFFQSIFFNRYLLYAIPGSMLILASSRRKIISAIALGIVLGLFINIDYHYFTHPTKRPFRQLAEYVQETRHGDDFLINWNSSSHHLWETKYYAIPAPIYLPGEGQLPFFVGTALMTDSDVIRSLPPRIRRLGVITSGPIAEVIIPGYTSLEDPRIFGDLKYLWLEKK